MGRIYTVEFDAVAITAAQDLFELTAGSAAGFEVMRLQLNQYSDFGDAQDEALSVLIKSGQTVSGSGGTAPTPRNQDTGSADTAAFAAEANNTTKANTGTILTHEALVWWVRGGLDKLWAPEERIFIKAARRMTVELVGAPADSLTCNGTITVREF